MGIPTGKSPRIDKLHEGERIWAEANGAHLFATHKVGAGEGWGKLRHLNEQGMGPVANITTRHSGIRATEAPPERAGGTLRQPYICKGALCIETTAVFQDCGLYNGAFGAVVEIVFREGDRPPWYLPAIATARFAIYNGPVCLTPDPKVAPIAPIGRFIDCVRRFSRLMAPIAPNCEVTVYRSHGMSCGAGRVADDHPATPSIEQSHPGGLYTACHRAQSAGRGSFGEPGRGPPDLYHSLSSAARGF